MKWWRVLAASAVAGLFFMAGPGANPALAAAPRVTIDQPVADSVKSAAFAVSGKVD